MCYVQHTTAKEGVDSAAVHACTRRGGIGGNGHEQNMMCC